jgi:hypothetical protein
MNSVLKARALEEFKLYWLCTAYLFVALGSFILYRRLILAEAGLPYLNYGVAAIEAMIIAKVVLIGRALKVGTRFENRPIAISIAYKTVIFGLVVLAFGVLERVVTGLIRRQTMAAIVQNLESVGIYELLARVLMMTIAFIPMFAFWEVGRTIGLTQLRALFLEGPAGASGGRGDG